MRVILLLAANPRGTEQLRLDEEVKNIEKELERSRRRDEFKLVVKWAVTDDDFRRAMLDHEPEIVHFLGHGTGSGAGRGGRELVPDFEEERGGLAFEDERGQVLKISGDSLARLFELYSDQVKCVVLNACFSDVQGQAIAQWIDFVIGMSQAIGDVAAVKFAVGFYDAIFAGKTYDLAFKFGRSAIDLRGIPEHLTPVLRTRQPQVGPAPVRPTSPVVETPKPPGPEAALARPISRPEAVPPKPCSPTLDRREVERAKKDLAEFIGPIGYVIAGEQAARARNLRHLYELLSAEIPSDSQRKRFLERGPR